MYKDENDIRTPRDRIDEELARRLLELGSGSAADTDNTHRSAPRRELRDIRCPDDSGCNSSRDSRDDNSTTCFSSASGHANENSRCGGNSRCGENSRCSGNSRCGENRRNNRSGSCGYRGGFDRNVENNGRGACGCDSGNNLHELVGFPLAMVYSPVQAWRCVYDINTALDRGTLFKELDKPLEAVETTGRCGGCKR